MAYVELLFWPFSSVSLSWPGKKRGIYEWNADPTNCQTQFARALMFFDEKMT